MKKSDQMTEIQIPTMFLIYDYMNIALWKKTIRDFPLLIQLIKLYWTANVVGQSAEVTGLKFIQIP